MGVQLNVNVPNQIIKGTVIYAENEAITGICVLLKGRVQVQNKGSKAVLNQGSFLGLADLSIGRYISTYVAMDDCIVYAYDVSKQEKLENIMNLGKDYSGLLISSLNKSIIEYQKTHSQLKDITEELYNMVIHKYERYKKILAGYNQKHEEISQIKEMKRFEYEEIDTFKLDYYISISKIPVDVQKQFYGSSFYVTQFHIEEQSNLIMELNKSCIEMSAYIKNNMSLLIDDAMDNVFKRLAKVAIDIDKVGGKNNDIVEEIDEIIALLNKIEKTFYDRIGQDIEIDKDKIEELYFVLISGTKKEEMSTDIQVGYSKDELTSADENLANSLEKILKYSEIDEAKANEMKQLINAFKILPDKLVVDNDARLIRKKIADLFYDIYERVFKKAVIENNSEKNTNKGIDKVIDMFLQYGYIDENLLDKEQILELYYLKPFANTGRCKVYSIKEWLLHIYHGKAEPSKNEFDMDYVESLRELKKSKHMTEEEQKRYLTDQENKVSFEIRNFFRSNHKLVNGQITVFVPFLYKEMFTRTVKKSYIDALMVNEQVDKLLEIDYSIFYREALFIDASKGIEKERIMKQVMPDFVLMPTCGINGVMWQETATKKKDTRARFTIPIFSNGDLNDILINIFARYRWEICRSIQGLAWNDIREKSLTSEYADYIQFYRKNKDLTEQTKEKLRLQIQRGRNNLKEVFAIDYEAWIKSESQGGIRLNKVVRAILYMHCPFSKDIRTKLSAQPIFTEISNKYNALNFKKIKDIENHYISLKRSNVTICKELEENLRFYKDM